MQDFKSLHTSLSNITSLLQHIKPTADRYESFDNMEAQKQFKNARDSPTHGFTVSKLV